MKISGLYSCFIFLMMILIVSCGTSKKIKGTTEEMSVSAFIKNINQQKLIFTHLTVQSKIDADIDNTKVGLNGKIYIKNNQKIWVSVSKFGLTAARAQITPNGFQAYEKLNRTYIDGDFSYFNNLLKVDFINYQKLQNLMLGRMFADLHPKDFELQIADNQYQLLYKDNDLLMRNPKAGKYYQLYSFDHDFRLVSAVLKDSVSGMELNIEYNGWMNVGPQYFPKNVKVLVKDKKTQKIELEYNNFTFEESPTPFEIPSGYKPNDILR